MEEKLKMLAIQLKETGTDFAAVRNCLDEIIGTANYCVEYSDPQIVKTGSKENFIVKCRISILDNNRSVIMVRELYSANEITYEDQAPVNLTNALVRAQEEAFKRTCLTFFAAKESTAKKGVSKPTAKPVSTATTAETANANQFVLVFTSKFEPMEHYNNAFKAACLYNGKPAEAICWFKLVNSMRAEGTWENLIASLPGSTPVTVQAKKGFYRGVLQFTIEKFL